MSARLPACLTLIALAIVGSFTLVRAEDAKPALRVVVDATLAPDLTDWLSKSAEVVKQQHPKISALLATEGFEPPLEVRLVADTTIPFPGMTQGSTIRVSAKWVRENPDDIGMIVHELVHVIQHYPPGPGWVTEGIADYYRYYVFEPGSPRAAFDLGGANYKRGYQPTAAFFDYIAREHDERIIAELNAAMRRGAYRDELFKDRTGKTADELWALFVESKK